MVSALCLKIFLLPPPRENNLLQKVIVKEKINLLNKILVYITMQYYSFRIVSSENNIKLTSPAVISIFNSRNIFTTPRSGSKSSLE